MRRVRPYYRQARPFQIHIAPWRLGVLPYSMWPPFISAPRTDNPFLGSGPLHGGANEAVIRMLVAIGR